MTAMFTNPAPQAIADLLRRVRTVAVVGLSPNASRPSHRVARGMQRFGQGEAFSESWRMEREQGENQPWLVAGIRQNG